MARLPDPQALGAPSTPEPKGQIMGVSRPGIAEATQSEESLRGVGELANQLAQAGERVMQREDAIESLRSLRTYREKANEEARRILAEGDLADPKTTKSYADFLNQLEGGTIGSFGGREDARIKTTAKIQEMKLDLVDRVAGASIKAQQDMVKSEMEGHLNQLGVKIKENPGQVFNHVNEFSRLIDDLPISPETKRAHKRAGQGFLYETAINEMVTAGLVRGVPGAMNDAWDLINNPEVAAALGESRQKAIFNRIDNIPKMTRVLTTTETSQLGFPSNVIVQRKGDGSLDVVFKPEKDAGVRERKIADLTARFVASGMDNASAAAKAQDIADGNLRIEVVPGLGVVREVNVVSGTAREVQLDEGQSAVVGAVPQTTLFQLAQTGAIAGVFPGAQEALGRTAGQIPGVPVATDVIQARQEVQVAQNELVRALSVNRRFPSTEMERIRKEIQIEPAMMDSTEALLARMKGMDKSLRVRLANEEATAKNPNLPQQMRADAIQSSRDIRNFLNRLGVPGRENQPAPPDGLPPGAQKIGKTKSGKDVYQAPNGKKYVVD